MKIIVNGQPETIQPCSIGVLVKAKGLKTDSLIVEHNQQIVPQEHWDHIILQDDDALELLSFVGGG